MAEESKAAVMRVPSLLLDAIGATLLIVGGEIAGHGIAYGEGGRIIGIGSVIFLFGLASIAAGIFWSRAESAPRLVGIATAALMITWVFFVYDIYDRYTAQKASTSFIVGIANAVARGDLVAANAAWTEKQKDEVVSQNADLTNQAVKIDGRNFIDCKLSNTILIYEGQLPTAIKCVESAGSASVTLQTENPVVSQAFDLYHMACEEALRNKDTTLEHQNKPPLPAVRP